MMEQKGQNNEQRKKDLEARIVALSKEENSMVDHLLRLTESAAITKIEERLKDLKNRKMRLEENLKQDSVDFDVEKFEAGLKLYTDPVALRKTSSIELKRKLLKKWFKEPITVSK